MCFAGVSGSARLCSGRGMRFKGGRLACVRFWGVGAWVGKGRALELVRMGAQTLTIDYVIIVSLSTYEFSVMIGVVCFCVTIFGIVSP